MRVIAGKNKGTKLYTLEGEITRPTSERAKEALFNILNTNIEGKNFLDLFSGSGAIAIESASRGAKEVIAVEKNKEAIKIIEKNLEKVGNNNVQLKKIDAIDFLQNETKQYDYIFIDPPYKSNLVEQSIKKIIEKDLLKKDGTIIAEIDSKDTNSIKEKLKNLQIDIYNERKYGRNTFLFISCLKSEGSK